MSEGRRELRELSDGSRHLLRFLIASPGGVDLAFLSRAERAAAEELVNAGLATEAGTLVIGNRDDERLAGLLAPSQADDAADGDEMRELLSYLQTLTAAIGASGSVSDLFRAAFLNLSARIEFDLAVAVTVEQHLHFYVSRHSDAPPDIDEGLVSEIRSILERQLSVSFGFTDVVMQGDFPDLGSAVDGADPLEHKLFSTLRIDNRPAGVLLVCRHGRAFDRSDQRLLDFVANQISLLVGTVRMHEQVVHLADTDELTGIRNRRFFYRQLEAELGRSRIYRVALTVMTLDIDNFKEINDTYGHPMGDVVLSEFCGIVRDSLRPPDVFARIGGDEFAIMLPHTDVNGAQHLADRLLRKTRELKIPIDMTTAIGCTLSMGIASYVPGEMTGEQLMRLADERLYVAKKNGKNQYA